MTAAELIAKLRRNGVELWAHGDKLRFRVAHGKLDRAFRNALVAQKSEVLALLHQETIQASSGDEKIVPSSRTGALPLSFAQQRLWFLDQLEPDNAAYNIPFVLRIDGELDRGALQQTLDEIIRRHETMRAHCPMSNGLPEQHITPELHLPLPVAELPGKQAGDPDVRERIRAVVRRPFDLSTGPLLRAELLQLGAQQFILVLVMHHFIADGWSMRILHQELAALYDAFRQGHPSPLPPLTIQYADFARWQRRQVDTPRLKEQLDYWRRTLHGAPAVLTLPADHPRPPMQSHHGASLSFALPVPLSDQLRALSRHHGVTLFMMLLAAFKLLLYRYTQQSDVVIGTAASTRSQIETEGLIGTFANNLVLRSDFSDKPAFVDLLRRVQQVALEAYAHQDIPFERLLEELQPHRDMSTTPLFQILFQMHQGDFLKPLSFGDTTFTPLEVESGTSRFDLTLSMADEGDKLTGRLEYNTDLFEPATMARLLVHFETVLGAIVENPDQRIDLLPLLPPAEVQQMVEAWNATAAELPLVPCMHRLFEVQAERQPDQVAAVFGEQELSYGQLNQRANQLAHYLRKRLRGPEPRVAIFMERSIDALIAMMAVHKAGAAYIPLDPAFPSERLAFMVEDAEAEVLLSQQALAASVPAHGGELIFVDSAWPEIARESADNPGAAPDGDALAYILYTSGSTGRPKGVQIPYRALVNFLLAMQAQPGMAATDRLLSVTTLSFDISGLELFLPLISGARVILAGRDTVADGALLAALIDEAGATVMQATPATWTLLLESGWQGKPDLKILCGGEAMPKELAARLTPRCGELWNMYGPTETTIWSTCCRIAAGDQPISVGRPIANTQVYILDDNFYPVPAGAPGELYIAGDGLARGYFRRPALTAERFLPNPLQPGGRLYKTGDQARWFADGRIECLGRLDHQVKIRGFRIELGDVEAALRRHDDVEAAVAMVREDTPGDKRLVGYIVWRDGQNGVEQASPGNSRELRQFLQHKLPDYMIPSQFIAIESVPLTPNGKVDRQALPAPEQQQSHGKGQIVPAASPMELVLAQVWQEVLGVEQVSVHDNFFDLGGHSLLSVAVIAKVEQQIGYRLSARDMMIQTLGQLAMTCETQVAAAAASSDSQSPAAKSVRHRISTVASKHFTR